MVLVTSTKVLQGFDYGSSRPFPDNGTGTSVNLLLKSLPLWGSRRENRRSWTRSLVLTWKQLQTTSCYTSSTPNVSLIEVSEAHLSSPGVVKCLDVPKFHAVYTRTPESLRLLSPCACKAPKPPTLMLTPQELY